MWQVRGFAIHTKFALGLKLSVLILPVLLTVQAKEYQSQDSLR